MNPFKELVRRSVSYDRDFQPPTAANCYSTDRNEAERKSEKCASNVFF